jgi:hypothetical protein
MQKPILFSVAVLLSSLAISSPALSSPVVGLSRSQTDTVSIALSQPAAEQQKKTIEVAYTYCGWFTDGAAPKIRRDKGGRVIKPVDWPADEAEFRCIKV